MSAFYYHITNKTIHTLDDIKATMPNASFPKNPDVSVIGYVHLKDTPPPAPSEATKVVVFDEVGYDEDTDVYYKKWKEEDRFTGEDKATKDAEYQASLDANKAFVVRQERNQLLLETDWWAVSDRKMSDAEKNYRQALRDLPTASGFPYSVTFPTKP